MKPLTVKIFGKQEHTGNNSRLQNFEKKKEKAVKFLLKPDSNGLI